MKYIAKFSITLNSIVLNDCTSALAYIKQICKNQIEVDKETIQKQITNNQKEIIRSFKHDSYQLAQFVKYAQQLTSDPLNSYQNYLLEIIQSKFPSKPFLLQCLKLNCECNLEILQTMPNSEQYPLAHAVLNNLIHNHTLDYKESTSVLHFLHNKKLLKQLLKCDWVMTFIDQSKYGLKDKNLKNLALLSRIYSDVGYSYLNKVADVLEKVNLDSEQSNQLSYVTLYQNLSVLRNKRDILQKISDKIILSSKTDKQALMQLLIGVSQSKDKLFAKQLFQQLNEQDINEEDRIQYYLTGTYFQLLEEQKILKDLQEERLYKLLKKMNNKQVGEFCLNLKTNYSINLSEYIQQNPQLIHPMNVANLLSIDDAKILNLNPLIKSYIKDKLIDMPGIMKLSTYSEYKKNITEAIITYTFDDIAYNVKELAAILLNIDQEISELGQLTECSIKAVDFDLSNAIGLGNILYLSFKKSSTREVHIPNRVLMKIIKYCDSIELLNFMKGLDKQQLLTEDLKQCLLHQIKKNINDKNKARVERHISKLPKQLQFQLD